MNGKTIKVWRKRAGLTQRQLAAMLGLNEQMVARWEKGQGSCSGAAYVLMVLLMSDHAGAIRQQLSDIASQGTARELSMRFKFDWHIADDLDFAALKGEPELLDPERQADERLMDERTEIQVEFMYPLRSTAIRTIRHAEGFTKRLFAEAISGEYRRIYLEERDTAKSNPQPLGPPFKPSEMGGVHGIWGHGIGDLVLEGAYRKGDVWHIEVGS